MTTTPLTLNTFNEKCALWHDIIHEDHALTLSALIRTAEDALAVCQLACGIADAVGVDAPEPGEPEEAWRCRREAWLNLYQQVGRWDRTTEAEALVAAFERPLAALDAYLDVPDPEYPKGAASQAWLLLRALKHAAINKVQAPKWLASEKKAALERRK